MIESWELERHEALVARSRKTGGYVYVSGGQRMRIEHQEFPYDVGIWRNLCQGMGTHNILMWFLPFGGGPGIESAASYEVNGFEDEGKVWPPPDPDKMPRAGRPSEDDSAVKHYGSVGEEVEAFKRRQQKDYERRAAKKRQDDEDGSAYEDSGESESEYEEGMDGEEGWTNSDGDRLKDYGVDEEAEVLGDDEIPLGELLRRRKLKTSE